MKTIEERRKYDRERMAKWIAANPEAREKNRLNNIKWRKNNPGAGARATANYRKKYPERIKDLKLRKNYDITFEEYQRMHDQQKGLCAICNQPEKARHNHSKKVQQLAVDHCHKTGKVRALLCQDCNRGIGKFYDNPKNLILAAGYIIFYKSQG